MWNLDCFVESDLVFAVNSYSYKIVEDAFLAAKDILTRNKITGIYAVDIYSDDVRKKHRFYSADELKLFFTFL